MSKKKIINPIQNEIHRDKRVIKGGGWHYYIQGCRLAYRSKIERFSWDDYLSFRVNLVKEVK